ncbi:MAG: alpha/beta fold hydrolase [Nitrospinaceae bacterium]|jgi:aminoacrylate hydrolase|nr:alpha/beta fold hydrolase [Nitrospinaceae bacterium]MBT3434137.1 alpha/beta fold hydrolase [Nitrospinaceae bacterium]MBT4092338.1 alpha/beta fold hydrolase [Nitrospinaceae bacterium]MBT4431081.1 alpha/beta fold hydrolase [Nitrospinaceae bacterium]MBT5946617.1 alpha/beta fold hydrolase [Nitrospinaceae bacterium]
MPIVNSGGVDIDYEILNADSSATPVFFISGLGGGRESWPLQAEPFSKERPVVLHDHRGTGKSAKPPGVYSVPNMAGDVVAIMDDAGIPKAHLVGSSTGGAIIQIMCIDHPEKVQSAAITSSWPKSDAFFIRQFTMRKKILLELGWDDYTRISALSLHSPKFFTDNFSRIEDKENLMIKNAPPAEIMAERIDAIIAHDQIDRLGQITAPTLVAVAQDDACTPPYYSDQLVSKIPGAELHVFEWGGHFVYLANTEEFNRVIHAFIEKHDG